MRIENQEVEKIGQGEFSTAYRVIDSDIVYILSRTDDENNQYVKDIYVHSTGKHIPEYETIELERYFSRIGYRNVYKTRFYHPLTAKNKEAWKHYKTIKATWDKIRYATYKTPDDWYQYMYDLISELRDSESVPESLVNALDRLYSWATAYGSNFMLEFSPRNLKIDNNGDLILLDILFFERSKTRY